MYCELGGDVCGEIGHLGHEKEAVCIVIICMWGDQALGTREGDCMYCELGGDVCREIGRLGHETEVVCIVGHEKEVVCIAGWRLPEAVGLFKPVNISAVI